MELYEFDTETYQNDATAWEAFKKKTSSKTIIIHNFYEVLFILRHQLVDDVYRTSSKEVAESLNMGTTKFSYINQILRAEQRV